MLVAAPFWLCALTLHCYQPKDLKIFWPYGYTHPLHPTAQQTIVSYKVHVAVATR
jgi:hypothetical protein